MYNIYILKSVSYANILKHSERSWIVMTGDALNNFYGKKNRLFQSKYDLAQMKREGTKVVSC